MRLLGRLVLGAIALGLAIPCGAIVLAAGILIDPDLRTALGDLGFAGLMAGLADLAAGLPPETALAAMAALARALFVLLVLPPSLAAILGESFGWRALTWYCGASGLLTAAIPWLARSAAHGPRGAVLAAEGRIAAILFLSGAASGLVYWLIAGRAAQSGRPERGPYGTRSNRP